MTLHNFGPLSQQYPAVIQQMPDVFNAHQFILEFARQNQALYVEALYTYRNGNPFQAVHKQLTEMLKDFPHLVVRHGDDPNSHDIWTNSNGCSRWRKIQATAGVAIT